MRPGTPAKKPVIYKGDNFEYFFRVRNADGTYVDFTDATGTAPFKTIEDGTLEATGSVTCTAEGVLVELDDTDTADLAPGDDALIFHVRITFTTGFVRTYIKSRVDVVEDV